MGEPLTPLIAAARAYVYALVMGLDTADEEAALLDAARAAAPSPEGDAWSAGYSQGWDEGRAAGPTFPPAPVPAAGLREAAQRVMDSHRKGYWSDEFDALEAALLDSDKPGLDVELLAKTLDSLGWPLRHRRMTAEWIAAEYARLQETPDAE